MPLWTQRDFIAISDPHRYTRIASTEPQITRFSSMVELIVTLVSTTSEGPAIRLPGSEIVAPAHFRALESRSAISPSSAKNPANRQSPAPTDDLTSFTFTPPLVSTPLEATKAPKLPEF